MGTWKSVVARTTSGTVCGPVFFFPKISSFRSCVLPYGFHYEVVRSLMTPLPKQVLWKFFCRWSRVGFAFICCRGDGFLFIFWPLPVPGFLPIVLPGLLPMRVGEKHYQVNGNSVLGKYLCNTVPWVPGRADHSLFSFLLHKRSAFFVWVNGVNNRN